VGKFVEFFGPALGAAARRPGDDREHEPRVRLDVRDLPDRRRDAALPRVHGAAEGAARPRRGVRQGAGLWHDETSEDPTYSDLIELDLSEVVPSIAGPRRPQDRVSLTESQVEFREALEEFAGAPDRDNEDDKAGVPPHRSADEDADAESFPSSDPPAGMTPGNGDAAGYEDARPREHDHSSVAERVRNATKVTMSDGTETEVDHGHVVIAAITSCTNTSNPSVMLGAGLLARNALEKGLKTQAVGQDVARAGLARS
jgi:aconitate hydratase